MKGPIDPGSWHYRQINERAPTLRVLADTLNELAAEGYPVAACTADLQYSNGLVEFARANPERFLQFGISEQNMVSAAAGLATTGIMPFVATFASFLSLLCCEQIRTDIAYSALPVRLVGHHTGIAMGFYGTSHHATEDLAIMRSIADLTVVAPADGVQFAAAIRASMAHPQPIYFRIGRGHDPQVYDTMEEFRFGKAVTHFQGKDLTIIATGSTVHPALTATKSLRSQGLEIGFIDMHTVKPLDRDAVVSAMRSRMILTVEEHNILGGLGGAVAEVMSEFGGQARLLRHGIKDEYSLIAPPSHLYAHYRLDAPGIETVAREMLSS